MHLLIAALLVVCSIAAPSVSTRCNAVDLTSYNISSIVKSGYLSLPGKKGSALSFIFYGKQGVVTTADLSKYPTLIWLGGGPGESSLWGNFNEIGPLLVRRKLIGAGLQMQVNKNSWHREFNLLFMDQPVGTGLSYADETVSGGAYARNSTQIASDFYAALKELYQNNSGCFSPQFLNINPSAPIYIVGQEYGGKLAAVISDHILREKEQGGFLSGLRGLILADAMVEPYDMMTEFGNHAYHLSLIDYQQRTAVERMLINATVSFQQRDPQSTHDAYKRITEYILNKGGSLNPNNFQKFGNYEDLINQFMHLSDTYTKFNLNPEVRFGMQSGEVYLHLYNDFMNGASRQLGNVLRNNIPVLVYAGQDSLFTNPASIMKWCDRLGFNQGDEFRKQILVPWKINNKIVGTRKSAGRLELRVLFGAGRYGVMDQPEAAWDMVKQWVNNNR